MYCIKCGAENKDMAKFCISCGAKLERVASSPDKSASAETPSSTVQPESLTLRTRVSTQPAVVRPLTSGSKLSAGGALVALVCFFLPWVESCSGWDMASRDLGAPELRWMMLVLVASIAGLTLTLFLRKAEGLWQIILMLVGLAPLLYNF